MNKTKSFHSPKSRHVNSNTKKLLRPSYNPSAYISSYFYITVNCQKIFTQIQKLLKKMNEKLFKNARSLQSTDFVNCI